jgi:hypothetical protein
MARVIPFPGVTRVAISQPSFAVAVEEMTPEERYRHYNGHDRPTDPCIVCGSAVDWDLHCACTRCAALMHEQCYYGRVASLDEWREFLRIVTDDSAPNVTPPWPDRLCAACRT